VGGTVRTTRLLKVVSEALEWVDQLGNNCLSFGTSLQAGTRNAATFTLECPAVPSDTLPASVAARPFPRAAHGHCQWLLGARGLWDMFAALNYAAYQQPAHACRLHPATWLIHTEVDLFARTSSGLLASAPP
jgi:hypothetical protein